MTSEKDGQGCLKHLLVPERETIVLYKDNGDPVVYKRRWFVLLAVGFSYMAWLQHTLKHVPLTAEYASYFDTTNEFKPGEGELGIDFFSIFEGLLVLFFYPVAGKLLDNFGLKMMIIGTILQSISAWWFYLAFTNFTSAILSRILASIAGPLISTSLLKISMQWFPPKERPLAIGIAVLLSESGAGLALLQSDFFLIDSNDILSLDFKSCLSNFIDKAADNNITECNEEAREAQCCLFNVNIELLNLSMAILTTIVAIYSILVIKERPPTSPSISSLKKNSPTFKKAIKIMIDNKNYVLLCITDFLMSGPPQVLFITLSRIVPANIEGYEIIGAVIALLLSIPISFYISYKLNNTKKYYEYTVIIYTSGLILWLLATISLLINNTFFDILFVIFGSISFLFFILWTSIVYELKEEYLFHKDYYIEGFIVGIDRAIINLSLVIFLSSIPPERADNLKISGAQFTLLVGLIFMVIGTIIVWNIPNKREYRRTQFEMDNIGKQSLFQIEDRENDFDHLEDDNIDKQIDNKQS